MGTNRRWCWKKVKIHNSEQKWCYFHADVNKKYTLTHCGLVMPYGHIKKSKLVRVMACHLMAPNHYPKWCWLIIRVISCGIDLRAMSQKMLPIFIIHVCLQITNRKFQPHFPVTNELKYKYLSLNKGHNFHANAWYKLEMHIFLPDNSDGKGLTHNLNCWLWHEIPPYNVRSQKKSSCLLVK